MIRLAARFLQSQLRHDRWRIGVIFLGACTAALALGVLSTGRQVREAVQDRREQRIPTVATVEASSDIWLSGTIEYFNGSEIQLLSLEPARQADQSVLPPGLTAMPSAGESILSPRLAALSETEPLVAARFPGWKGELIAPAGLSSPGELIAYTRPPTEGSLPRSSYTERVSGFGQDLESFAAYFYGDPIADGWTASMLAIVAVLIPTLLILAASVSARSEVLEQRIETLNRVGAGQAAIRRLLIFDTAAPAAVGAGVGLLIMYVATSFRTTLPFAGYEIGSSDMRTPIVRQLLVVFIVTGAASGMTVMTFGRYRSNDASGESALHHLSESKSGGLRITARRVARFATTWIGPVLIMLGTIVRGEPGANTFVVGVMLFLLGLPASISLLLKQVGDQLARSQRVAVHLAGCRIRANRRASARLLVTLFSLLVIMSIMQVFFTRFDPPGELSSSTVSAFDIASNDVATPRLIDSLTSIAGVQAITVRGSEVTSEDEAGQTVDETPSSLICGSSLPNCPAADGVASLAELFPELQDSPTARSVVPTEGAGELSSVLGETPPRLSVTVVADRNALTGVIASLATQLSVPYFQPDELNIVQESPLIGWINLGLLVFVGLCLVAIALSYTGVIRSSAISAGSLVRLGADQTVIARTVTAEVGVPFVSAASAATLASAAIAIMYAYLDRLSVPSLAFMFTLGSAALALGIVISVVVASYAPRMARRIALGETD